jgi:hypothetical protein
MGNGLRFGAPGGDHRSRKQPRLVFQGRLTVFVARHELAWDLSMGFLTIVYVVLAFQEDSVALDIYAVWVLSAVFVTEFVARCYDTNDRIAYLQGHWLDLITAVPVPGIPGLRFIRLLRLFRFLKVGVLVRRLLLARGWDQGGLIWPTLVIFWLGSALGLWLVEHDAIGSSISTFPDAMSAAFLTAATLGFGKHSLPVTQDGQIIAAVIVFFALGLWGFASSNLTRMWLNANEEARNDRVALEIELRRLSEQVARLGDLIAHRNHGPTTDQVPEDRREEPELALP